MPKIKFWKPGSDKPGAGLEEERPVTSAEAPASAFVFNPNLSLSVEQQRQRLPIFKHRNHILYLLETYQTVVIIGETGSGKSTQIPQYLYEAGWAAEGHQIAITQPRRVAVVTVANRVADEQGVVLGLEVGYAIRFENCTDENATRIKFMTDGYLIRELMSDPLLTKYSVVMLDEAHERTLNTDVILGLMKKVIKKRPDLKVIVASATLDAETFQRFFNTNDSGDPNRDTSAILTVEGRMFPVDVHYSNSPVPNYLKTTVETVMQIHHTQPEGDVLCFLTGQDEVENVVSLLIDEARKLPKNAPRKLRVLPMYSSLPAAEQMKVFQRTSHSTRKIVVATNIAEASITISGIVFVIDCGFVKLPVFNSKSGVESLIITPISQASAQQRAGRAGRVRSGKAYRLYTEESYDQLTQMTVPEMQRCNMALAVLQLKALGVNNILRFQFLSPPPAENMVRGLDLLSALGALDEDCRLTSPLGLALAELPLHPMFSKMLLVSEEHSCSEEALAICAMMQINNVFISPSQGKKTADKAKRKFAVEEGDHITLLNVFKAFLQYEKNPCWCHENYLNYKGLCRAVEIREQLLKLITKFKVKLVSCGADVEPVQKCITAGFFSNAAKYHYSGVYRTLRDDYTLHVHPTSVLFAEMPPAWVVFSEVVQTTKEYMRDVTVIKPEWLHELAPHFYEYGTERERMTKRHRPDLS